ncbi:MAG TPA: MarR family winged helix-turn-helix transcriptional regulator [Xanthobacteraceae bacterium]|nr:MarR family winged helix-turn-helix transcriptional regulator [Xanthobacteraceae bacterium]
MAKPKTKTTQRAAAAAGGHYRFDLEHFVPYRVSILATLIRRALSEIYRDDPGLTEPEWKVFTTIAHMGPLPSGDIGLHMTLDRMAISRALGRLISLQLVGRAPLPSDARMSEVNLTPHGSKVFDKLARQAVEIEKAILAPLSAGEVGVLLALIDKIEMNFRAHGSPRRPVLIATAKAMSSAMAGARSSGAARPSAKAGARRPRKKAPSRASG